MTAARRFGGDFQRPLNYVFRVLGKTNETKRLKGHIGDGVGLGWVGLGSYLHMVSLGKSLPSRRGGGASVGDVALGI